MANHKAITETCVIVSEGFYDTTFLQALAAARNLPSFNYRHAGGITKIGTELRGLSGATNFGIVEHVLIIADCDDNAQANFAEVCNQIQLANDNPPTYATPVGPLTRAGVKPTVNVALVPGAGMVGDLETMCLCVIAKNDAATIQCVEDFATCTGAANWPPSKRAKMKLEAYLAAHFSAQPQILLGYAWWDLAQGPMPLDDPDFDEIANIMESYR